MNRDINLKENTIIELSDDNETINLTASNDATIIFKIKAVKNLKVTGNFDKYNINIIYLNENTLPLQFIEDYHIDGAYVNLCHGQFCTNDLDLTSTSYLNKGDFNINTYGISKANSRIIINVKNVLPNTNGKIDNYIIGLKGSSLIMDAIGEICKGAYNSKNLQTSKCLTFDEVKSIEVLPVLIIDENDVSASHALSIGKLDELQKYYLQSRGLNEKTIYELITVGYILPITEYVYDDIKEDITKYVYEKVNQLCWT